jgi:hypothetical protein
LQFEADRAESEWQNAFSDEENYVARIAEIYSEKHEVRLLNVFKQHCVSGKVERVREFLGAENLRGAILNDLQRCKYVDRFLTEIKAKLKAVTASADKFVAVLNILLSEPVLRRTVTESDLQKAILLENSQFVRQLLQVADDGVYIVTTNSIDCIENKPRYDMTVSTPEFSSERQEIVAMVTAAHELYVAKLNSQGRFQNRDVVLVPGDRPLRELPTPFRRWGYGVGQYPRLTAEQDFFDLSQAIRLKLHWRDKMQDPAIVDRWRVEAMTQGASAHVFGLVMEQLALLALVGQAEGFQISPVENVYQSDSILPEDLRRRFQSLAAALERAVPRDYHPFSQEQVVDVVHPSLYCAVTGLSRVRPCAALTLEASARVDLQDIGLPVLEVEAFDEPRAALAFGMSRNYQWIPAEFHVSLAGDVRINSYINNLHPQTHAPLYPILAQIFQCALPMLEQVLSDMLVPPLRLVDGDGGPMYDGGSMDFMDEEAYENRRPLPVLLPKHFPGGVCFEERFLQRRVGLRDKHLQVIVKIASIELTPERPEYRGGTWHVEGMQNEHIVATVIHYFSCDNITESVLSFRQAICEPEYEQNDSVGVLSRFGLSDEDPLNEELGHVEAQEGRTIAFPNLFQHCVGPFRLKDATCSGHRKILVFFVVDPLKRVLSSADIPPQQREWVLASRDGGGACEVLRRLGLPEEITAEIFSFLEFPMSRQRAEDIRLHLMDERSRFTDEITGEVFERPFSLCEH